MPDTHTELTVQLSQSGKRFSTFSNLSILESGLSAGMSLPYGCANGSCGDCKARIISGVVNKIRFHDYVLTQSEKFANICLLCSYAAVSDLIIEATEAQSVDEIPFQQLRGKLCHLQQHAGVWIARFKLTRGKALRYLPGQYACITFPDKQKQCLPIANCPCESSYLEFHIPVTSQLAIEKLKPLDRVSIEGPNGRFTLSDLKQPLEYSLQQSQKPVLFVADGLGFSAVKPLLEHVMSLDEETPCALVWIAEPPARHYQHNLCRSWSDAFDNLTYLPINSVEKIVKTISDNWPHELAEAEIYISGNSQAQCIAALTAAGEKQQLFNVDVTH